MHISGNSVDRCRDILYKRIFFVVRFHYGHAWLSVTHLGLACDLDFYIHWLKSVIALSAPSYRDMEQIDLAIITITETIFQM